MRFELHFLHYIFDPGTQVCDCSDKIQGKSIYSLWRMNLETLECKQVVGVGVHIPYVCVHRLGSVLGTLLGQ